MLAGLCKTNSAQKRLRLFRKITVYNTPGGSAHFDSGKSPEILAIVHRLTIHNSANALLVPRPFTFSQLRDLRVLRLFADGQAVARYDAALPFSSALRATSLRNVQEVEISYHSLSKQDMMEILKMPSLVRLSLTACALSITMEDDEEEEEERTVREPNEAKSSSPITDLVIIQVNPRLVQIALPFLSNVRRLKLKSNYGKTFHNPTGRSYLPSLEHLELDLDVTAPALSAGYLAQLLSPPLKTLQVAVQYTEDLGWLENAATRLRQVESLQKLHVVCCLEVSETMLVQLAGLRRDLPLLPIDMSCWYAPDDEVSSRLEELSITAIPVQS